MTETRMKMAGESSDTKCERAKVSLIVYNNRLFPAHWSLYVQGNEPSTRIHVTGEPSTGFCLEIERDYKLADDNRKHQLFPLGSLRPAQIADLEAVVAEVPAPGPSLRSHRDNQPPGTRVKLINCQTWIKMVMQLCVSKGIFEKDALKVVFEAPEH